LERAVDWKTRLAVIRDGGVIKPATMPSWTTINISENAPYLIDLGKTANASRTRPVDIESRL